MANGTECELWQNRNGRFISAFTIKFIWCMCLPRGFWEAFFDEKIILEESETRCSDRYNVCVADCNSDRS